MSQSDSILLHWHIFGQREMPRVSDVRSAEIISIFSSLKDMIYYFVCVVERIGGSSFEWLSPLTYVREKEFCEKRQ